MFVDSDAGIHTAVLKIRQALGNGRQSPGYVETVPGKGYRFIAPVEADIAGHRPADAPQTNLPEELTTFIGAGGNSWSCRACWLEAGS